MENRDWMYDGRISQGQITDEWMEKTEQFVNKAFDHPSRPKTIQCPCKKCGNRKRQSKEDVSMHLLRNGFTPSYKRWYLHGEHGAKRARTEPRQSQPAEEFATGFANCLDDFVHANAPESPHVEAETPQVAETSEEPEEETKKFYENLFAAQKPLHGHTDVTLLDAIARIMAVKCKYKWSRECYDEVMVVFASMLPKGHILARNFYESTKLLKDLKMDYEKIDACPKGCMLFRKEHSETQFCIHCKSSRYFEVDEGGGQKRQTKIPQKILRYLPFLPRLQ